MAQTQELMIRGVCGTMFVDLDGTVLNCSTENALPCAVQKINAAYDKGWMIVITTMRGDGYVNEQLRCRETVQTLRLLGLKYHHIVWNCPSPRVVINDEGCSAIKHPRDGSWEGYEF